MAPQVLQGVYDNKCDLVGSSSFFFLNSLDTWPVWTLTFFITTTTNTVVDSGRLASLRLFSYLDPLHFGGLAQKWFGQNASKFFVLW